LDWRNIPANTLSNRAGPIGYSVDADDFRPDFGDAL
jgi:hypothetical protein